MRSSEESLHAVDVRTRRDLHPYLRDDPSSTDVLAAAGQPALWITVAGVFLVIAAQSVIYYRAAHRAAPGAGMPAREVRTAFRAGAVASIGPSLAVCLIAITLISVLGTPAVLVRIGLIGSATYELNAAAIVAGGMGADLGGAGWTQQVFATALLAMSIAGAGWMVVTLVVTPLLKRGRVAVEGRTAGAMAVIPGAAMLGAFALLGLQQLTAGLVSALVALSSGLVMAGLLYLARRLRRGWIKEWALGIALVAGLMVALLLTSLGVA